MLWTWFKNLWIKKIQSTYCTTHTSSLKDHVVWYSNWASAVGYGPVHRSHPSCTQNVYTVNPYRGTINTKRRGKISKISNGPTKAVRLGWQGENASENARLSCLPLTQGPFRTRIPVQNILNLSLGESLQQIGQMRCIAGLSGLVSGRAGLLWIVCEFGFQVSQVSGAGGWGEWATPAPVLQLTQPWGT